MDPFIQAMARFLIECGNRTRRPGFVQNYLSRSANAQYEEDMKIMLDLTNESMFGFA
jgi:cytochrome P450/NADPH-cytochrome P450 reductase